MGPFNDSAIPTCVLNEPVPPPTTIIRMAHGVVRGREPLAATSPVKPGGVVTTLHVGVPASERCAPRPTRERSEVPAVDDHAQADGVVDRAVVEEAPGGVPPGIMVRPRRRGAERGAHTSAGSCEVIAVAAVDENALFAAS
jgi:hypothetical protein